MSFVEMKEKTTKIAVCAFLVRRLFAFIIPKLSQLNGEEGARAVVETIIIIIKVEKIVTWNNN